MAKTKKLDPDSKAALTRIFTAKLNRDVPYLTAALRDPDHRAMAAKYLADLGATDAIADIARLLDAKSDWARGSAIDALATLGGKSYAARILQIANEDPFKPNRLRAIAALGRLSHDGALEDIVPFLQSPDFTTRRAAAYSLGELGDARAVEALERAKRREAMWKRGTYREAVAKLHQR